jgi:cell wall-associated NlpC family hydrolase
VAKPKTTQTGPVPSGAAIASDAMTYIGSPYVWGGAPGIGNGHDQGTDCSGFVSMVLGRDLGLSIPGYAAGTYDGSQHGATVAGYIAWPGATTLGKSEVVQAGDLVCYAPDTHIGIATSGSSFVSALDVELGVAVTGITGAASGTVVYRRVNGVGQAPTGEGGTGTAGSVGSSLAGMAAAVGAGLGVGAGLVGLVLAGAAVTGLILAVLVGVAIRRAGMA